MIEELGSSLDGVATAELHRDPHEIVRYCHIDSGAKLSYSETGGAEILIIEGSVVESCDTLNKGAWLRLPEGQPLSVVAGDKGAMVRIKPDICPMQNLR